MIGPPVPPTPPHVHYTGDHGRECTSTACWPNIEWLARLDANGRCNAPWCTVCSPPS